MRRYITLQLASWTQAHTLHLDSLVLQVVGLDKSLAGDDRARSAIATKLVRQRRYALGVQLTMWDSTCRESTARTQPRHTILRWTYEICDLFVTHDLIDRHGISELGIRVPSRVLVVLGCDRANVLPGRAIFLAVLVSSIAKDLRRSWSSSRANRVGHRSHSQVERVRPIIPHALK